MNGKILWAFGAIIIIAGGWYLLSGESAKAPSEEPGTPVTNQMPVIGSTTPEMIVEGEAPVTVIYTDEGYAPKSITVAVGTTVTFVNQSSKNMWVASARHPEHTVYSGTSLSQHCPDTSGTAFDQCAGGAPGSSYSFTFTKVGEWKYHDHIDATKFGGITVTAAP